MPRSKRPPPPEHASKRMCGKAVVNRSCSAYTPLVYRKSTSPWRDGGSATEKASVRWRFMSHLMYETSADLTTAAISWKMCSRTCHGEDAAV